jgi:hypothetical protein
MQYSAPDTCVFPSSALFFCLRNIHSSLLLLFFAPQLDVYLGNVAGEGLSPNEGCFVSRSTAKNAGQACFERHFSTEFLPIDQPPREQ